MTGLVTPFYAGMIRHQVAREFAQTYTRIPLVPTVDVPGTPAVDESEDAWGDQAFTAGAAISGLPCGWLPASRQGAATNGALIVEAPSMIVPPDDPIKASETVQNVTGTDPVTGLPVVLFAGPAQVDNVLDGTAGDSGVPVYRRVLLRGAQENI